jgi:hypothetical protein
MERQFRIGLNALPTTHMERTSSHRKAQSPHCGNAKYGIACAADRTSPMANTPRRLLSRSCRSIAALSPVSTKRFGSSFTQPDNQSLFRSAPMERNRWRIGHLDLSRCRRDPGAVRAARYLRSLLFTAGEMLQLGSLASTDVHAARRSCGLRYWGAFLAAKYGSRNTREGGSIVFTPGTAAKRPRAGWALGASICAAMEGLTRA